MKGACKMKSKRLILSVIVALAGFLPQTKAGMILDSADGYAVLAHDTVTSTGLTVINGDLGVYPGIAVTGFGPGIVNGAIYAGVPAAQLALADAGIAYLTLAGEAVTQDLTGQNLGGLTLAPGVKKFNTDAFLTGILTLDAQGDSNARFDFQIGTTLITAPGASVLLINGAEADNVYWQVGSSATLDLGTAFEGTIIAYQSIGMNAGASLEGRALALNGAVTLDDNVITADGNIDTPEPGTFWLMAVCASVFGAWQRLAMWQRKAARA